MPSSLTPESITAGIMVGLVVVGVVLFRTLESWSSMITPAVAGVLVFVVMGTLTAIRVLDLLSR